MSKCKLGDRNLAAGHYSLFSASKKDILGRVNVFKFQSPPRKSTEYEHEKGFSGLVDDDFLPSYSPFSRYNRVMRTRCVCTYVFFIPKKMIGRLYNALNVLFLSSERLCFMPVDFSIWNIMKCLRVRDCPFNELSKPSWAVSLVS